MISFSAIICLVIFMIGSTSGQTTVEPIVHGICPPFTPLPIGVCTAIFHPHCDSDLNCTSGLKCCPGPCNQQYCQKPVTIPIVKPGYCPRVPALDHIWCPLTCGNGCHSDQDCPGREKCCRTVCNRLVCLHPIYIFPIVTDDTDDTTTASPDN